ncbi:MULTISPECIES: DUF998 domain-containing protein [Halomicrobium]|uniref:DUF998 domain-containing protein n=2 Tax=Halomicrobium mukohataei TaxID=57705 RepID=C7NZP0_HALMD|nr:MULTISPECIES: DUF998 domain-containing protein [Halomicrobium]ACV48808.1 Protein of unknown function DUF998 [Halomicrobium mukohataei DSM 12286]QCD64239.1 DUF998 domain-containing protein [Halomicrobium mukohataei]QFR19045.1 DUF998 domain-containing protein [Halomicrobium sp. ZPS1]
MQYERMAAWTGVGVPIVTLGAILLATTLSPGFDWTVNALSHLGALESRAAAEGVATGPTRLLFNGGLIVGGLAGLGFAGAVWLGSNGLVERLGAVVLGLSLLSLAGVGTFPDGTAPHFAVAIGHYLLFTVAFWLYGTGNVLAGDRLRGAVTILLGIAHLGGWYVWFLTGGVRQSGLAIPEMYGAVVFCGWVVVTAHWHLTGDRALGRPNS